jgi:hypothetical protein
VTAYYRWYTGFDREFPNELSVSPALSRSFGGVTSGSQLKYSTLTSPYWSGAVAVNDRFHFNRRWYFQPGVTVYIPYNYETEAQTPGSAQMGHDVNLYAAPTASIGFLPTDSVLVIASYTYTDNSSNAYPATGSSTSAQTAESTAALQVEFAF